jgi:hypothetical protein
MADSIETAQMQTEVVKGIDVSNVHVDAPLSNLSLAYMQDQNEYIASKFAPIVPVSQISGVYFKYSKRTFFENPTKKWTPGSKMAGGQMDMDTNGSYSCLFRAYEYPLPAHLAAAQDSMVMLERAVTEKVTRALLLDREIQIATDMFATGKWTGATELAGQATADSTHAVYWDDYANSDVLANIKTAKLAVKVSTGMTPNTLTVNEQVYEVLRLHPQMKEIYKYTQPAVMTEELISKALGLDKILIGKAVYMSSDEGAADALGYVFGKHALVSYVAPQVGLMTPTAAAIFSFTGMTGGFDPAVERVPDRRTHADYFQAYSCYDDKIVAPTMGAFFLSIIN